MSNGNGNGGVVAWWANYIVPPLLIASVGAVAGWAWALQAGHASQETKLAVHETRITWHEQQAKRMEDKLDEILREVRAK